MINISMSNGGVQMQPRITVFGVGGAGGNAVNNMIRAELQGVDFVVANTDAQALSCSLAERRIQLGSTLTRGLGAGARPDVGKAAAEEQIEEIRSYLDGINMVFITAGMGGGTGTGAAPVIARACREAGILTVGVVTKPFQFEGHHRMRLAESGIQDLHGVVDTLIIIPNQNLFRIANERTPLSEAFKMADDVLYDGVRGVTDLMIMPGLINLDFADIRTVMSEMGKAMMGTGEAAGEDRAIQAAEAAINNPLLDDVSMKGARGVLINVTGGQDLTLYEVDEAANHVRDAVDPDAVIIIGSTLDESLTGSMRVSVVATGIDAELMAQAQRQAQPVVAPVTGAQALAQARRMVGPGAVAPASAVAPGLTRFAPMSPAPTLVSPALHAPAPSQAPFTGQAAAPIAAAATPLAPPPPAYGSYAPGGYAAHAQGQEPADLEPAPGYDSAPLSEQPAPRGVAMTGTPRAERRGDQFIAPRPLEGGPRAPVMAPLPPQQTYAPYRAEPEAPPRKRSQSLFGRLVSDVTRAGRRIIDSSDGVTAAAPARTAPQPGASQRSAEPAPAPAAQTRLPAEPTPLPEYPRLSSTDEDMLDIPTFLRRQAN